MFFKDYAIQNVVARGLFRSGLEQTPEFFQTKQSAFPIKRSVLGILILLTAVIFGFSAYFADKGNLNLRILFFAIGPILGFIFYTSLILFFYYDHIKDDEAIVDILAFGFVGGLISIIFAISINSSAALALITTFDLFFDLSDDDIIQTVLIIMFGVIGAFTEEIAKSFPIFFASRGLYTYWGKRERRFLSSMQSIFVMGFIIGGLFSFLEAYWYIFNLSYLFFLDDPEIWNVAFGQIMIRTLSPLHIATTGIMAYGIGISLYNKSGRDLGFRDYFPYYISILIATALHGLWNGTLVYASFNDISMIEIFHTEIPTLLILYMVICVTLILYFVYFLWDKTFLTCEYCKERHAPPFTMLAHIGNQQLQLRVGRVIKSGGMVCKTCKKPTVENGVCSNCHSSIVYICGYCKSVIPINSVQCWNCKYELTPPYEEFFSYRESSTSIVAVGFFQLFASIFIISPILYLVYGINRGVDDFILVRLFFVLLLGLAFLISANWMGSSMKKSLGIGVARIFLAILLIQLGFILITIGNVIATFTIGRLVYINFILYYLEAFGCMVYSFYLLANYQPVIHGGSQDE